MIGVEFRDEDYKDLVEEAKKLVKQAHHVKKSACKIIKALAAIDDEDYDEDEEDEMDEMMGEETSFRHQGDRSHGSGVVYYRGARMRRSGGGRYNY